MEDLSLLWQKNWNLAFLGGETILKVNKLIYVQPAVKISNLVRSVLYSTNFGVHTAIVDEH